MPRAPNVPFEKNCVVAESGARFQSRLFQLFGEYAGLLDHAHAPPASAKGSFDDERKTDLLGHLARRFRCRYGPLCSRNHWNAGFLRQFTGRSLVTQELEQFRAWPDERNSGAFTSARQRGIFRKKAVPGVDCVHSRLFAQRYDAFDVKVGFDGTLALADFVGFIRLESMQAEPVFFREDGYRAQPQFGRCPHDADSDLAAIQSQEFSHLGEVLK